MVVRCMRRLWRAVSNGVARWSTQRLSQIDEVALLPLVAVAELGLGHVVEQRPAAARGPRRPAGPTMWEAWAPRNSACAAVHRIGADERVAHRRVLRALLGR